ncbi:unnamed protein product [Periconia digitata]|uniref:Tyrosinase copper-binding domain-containing protein n=1 Tax=Periconia digitata TaxID=1303443 RepID=A0A9W4UHT5_9PLEO|nr:unnamed protein product [Periconia digitata]
MRFSSHAALGLLAASITNALPAPQDDTPPTISPSADDLETLAQLSQHAQEVTNSSLSTGKRQLGSCTLRNLSVRREWGTLSNPERKAYTDAVLCLQKKQSKTPSSLIPGAKSRFDDWIGTHINQTTTIHYTGTFLAWHRYFTWEYEQALRNECGYKGTQPYWDWSKTAKTGHEKSPIFDGSEFSMSGNGELDDNKGDIMLGGQGLPEFPIPAGNGGGCVTSGPFKSMSVNLGPVQLSLPGGKTESNGDGLAYNPRCLKRDLTNEVNRRFANATSVVRNILLPKDVYDFQMTMQGYPGTNDIGIHGGGHFTIGGDPGRDLFTSPGDPIFYLHHSMIDRVWWMWQSLDVKKRTSAEGIAGTGTFMNQPPSPDTTLDTEINLGFAAGSPKTMRDLMSTTAGPFCYIYI